MEHLYSDHVASDMRMQTAQEQQEVELVSALKPKFGRDGNQYYFLYGDNLQEGVAGFGDTAHKAMLDFNRNWYSQNTNTQCRSAEDLTNALMVLVESNSNWAMNISDEDEVKIRRLLE